MLSAQETQSGRRGAPACPATVPSQPSSHRTAAPGAAHPGPWLPRRPGTSWHVFLAPSRRALPPAPRNRRHTPRSNVADHGDWRTHWSGAAPYCCRVSTHQLLVGPVASSRLCRGRREKLQPQCCRNHRAAARPGDEPRQRQRLCDGRVYGRLGKVAWHGAAAAQCHSVRACTLRL